MAPDTLIGRFRLVAPLPESEGARWQARAINDDTLVHIQLFELPAGPTAFLEAARRLMALTDPHVQPVLDADIHGGRGYLVTPATAGLELAGRLVDGPPPYKLAIDIGVSVLRGLTVAHAAGLAHGGLRAETIVWADGRVQIADLGRAALSGGGPSPADDLRAVTALLRQLAPDAPGELRALISAPPPTADAFCRALKTIDPALGQDADFDFSSAPTPMPPNPTAGLVSPPSAESWGVVAAASGGAETPADDAAAPVEETSLEPASDWPASWSKAETAPPTPLAVAESGRVAIRPPDAAHSDPEDSWGVAAPLIAATPSRAGRSWVVSARSMVEGSTDERAEESWAEETWGVRPGAEQAPRTPSSAARAHDPSPAVHAIGDTGSGTGSSARAPARSPLSTIAPIVALLVVGLVAARWYIESRDDGDTVPQPTVPKGLVAVDTPPAAPAGPHAAGAADAASTDAAPAGAAPAGAAPTDAAPTDAAPTGDPDTPHVELQTDPIAATVVRVSDQQVICAAATRCRVPIDIDYAVQAEGYVAQTVSGDDLYDRRRIGKMRVVLTPEAPRPPPKRKRQRR